MFPSLLRLLPLFFSAFAVAAEPQRLQDFEQVVIPEKPLAVQKAAAEELAHYVERITGKKLTIMAPARDGENRAGLSFYIGDAATAPVLTGEKRKPEEWLLQTVPTGLAIAGEDGAGDAWSAVTPAGSMIATYILLEDHLGVRWFWPGDSGEHVPRKPDATLPVLNARGVPPLEIRSVSLGYTRYHTKAFQQAARKWARRSRLAWVKSAVFGHSWEAAFEFRKGETFRDHPEWFALVKGKRRPPQMCTSNPEVIARMVEYVLAGKAQIMNISPSDGGFFCECERCRALDVPGVLSYDKKHVQLSDRIFTYANEVARRVRERNPAKGCGMFAYTYYNRPPLRIDRLEPNLYISFVFQSAAHRDAENLREWRESVAGWQKLGAKMVVREGWGTHYYFDLPFLHDRQIAANLAEAHRLGFMAAYGEGSKSFATMAPNYWALTHLLWDPTRDLSALMRDFYASAYGPAAREMEAYFAAYRDSLDQHWAERDRNVDTSAIAYANIIGAWRRLIPADVVETAERHLRAAEAKAPPGEYAERIALHRLGQDYTRTMLDLLDAYRELAVLGFKIDTFSAVAKERRDDPAERDALLKRAYELGEARERLLLAHRGSPGPDEGLYAITNDLNMRQWHAAVKKGLGIEKPSAVTKATLSER